MERREFLRWAGLSTAGALLPLPSFGEVEKIVERKNLEFDQEDPFWHIRKLMIEYAPPDWEYYFITTGEPTFAEGEKSAKYDKSYTIQLFQNGNRHAESFRTFKDMVVFGEKQQQWMFDHLIDGVNKWNSIPLEKREALLKLLTR